MNFEYSSHVVSVIIPTYNRAEDLKETLQSLAIHIPQLLEIIVVDQSKGTETKKLVNSLKEKKVRYTYCKTPSIPLARNVGVQHLSKKAKIVCFIDDDVTLGKNYFDEILKVFNAHVEAKAVAGYVPSPELAAMPFFERFLRRLFFLSFGEKDRARIISAYGNTYPSLLTRTIHASWLPGVNMAYKRGVFTEQQFDEHLLGYTVAEDIDFTYRLYKKYSGSLFITPSASLVHRVSHVERIPSIRMSYINQIDHLYFQMKNLRSWKQRLIFGWSLFGITLLRGMKVLSTRKKEDFLKFKYFLSSLGYCLLNTQKIQQGIVREFPQE